MTDTLAGDEGRPRPDPIIRVEVYHHFPDGIPVTLDVSAIDFSTLAVDITGAVSVTVVQPTPPATVATRAVLIITSTQGDTNMPGQITVDTTNETALFEFTDDHGDVTGVVAPSNASGSAVVSFTSDNPAAATIATDATNALQGDITPVAEGVANIGATLAYPDGTAVLEADGVTPFPVPAPVAVTVGPGPAAGDALVLSI